MAPGTVYCANSPGMRTAHICRCSSFLLITVGPSGPSAGQEGRGHKRQCETWNLDTEPLASR